MGKRMRFGAFMGPFHARRDNPTLALHRDLELVSLLDRLGCSCDEANKSAVSSALSLEHESNAG